MKKLVVGCWLLVVSAAMATGVANAAEQEADFPQVAYCDANGTMGVVTDVKSIHSSMDRTIGNGNWYAIGENTTVRTLTENVVAQMLTAAGRKLYFFSRSSATDRKERMEVDFLLAKSKLAKKNNIRPVEVKSGKNTTHRSLDKFRSKYADWLDSPYLLWDKDLKVKDGITYLPLYMAPLI